MSSTSQKAPASVKRPTHIAYRVRQREGKPSVWTRIGGAWAHADGQGFNLQLEVVPLDGRVTLRLPSEKKPQQ